MAIEKYLGLYKIRPLNDGEVYYCTEGCGECQKVIIEEDNMTKHDITDTILLERHYSKVEVSSCCNSQVGIWDNVLDSELDDVEYEFSPEKE